MPRENFGEILRELRIKAGFGLRTFAKAIGMQPSNLSFIENGRVSPPRNAEMLEIMAHELGLKEETEEWEDFFDAAAKKGEIPIDLKSDKEITEFIPILCRTISTSKLTRKQIIELVERVKNYKPSK